MLSKYVISAVTLSLATCMAWGETMSGKVTIVTDGDTIKFLDEKQKNQIVRLAGIDAPEKDQEFGQQAKFELVELCLSKVVEADIRTTDRYGRTVARVRCDGVDVAARMLEKGMAWHFSRYASSQPLHEAQSDKSA